MINIIFFYSDKILILHLCQLKLQSPKDICQMEKLRFEQPELLFLTDLKDIFQLYFFNFFKRRINIQ